MRGGNEFRRGDLAGPVAAGYARQPVRSSGKPCASIYLSASSVRTFGRWTPGAGSSSMTTSPGAGRIGVALHDRRITRIGFVA